MRVAQETLEPCDEMQYNHGVADTKHCPEKPYRVSSEAQPRFARGASAAAQSRHFGTDQCRPSQPGDCSAEWGKESPKRGSSDASVGCFDSDLEYMLQVCQGCRQSVHACLPYTLLVRYQWCRCSHKAHVVHLAADNGGGDVAAVHAHSDADAAPISVHKGLRQQCAGHQSRQGPAPLQPQVSRHRHHDIFCIKRSEPNLRVQT